MKDAETVRGKILETALILTEGDRNNTYGDPKTNLTCFANLVASYIEGIDSHLGRPPLDAVDAAVIMTLAKISRIAANKGHADNYLDGAAYMAIAGECAGIQIDAPKKESGEKECPYCGFMYVGDSHDNDCNKKQDIIFNMWG